MKTALVVCVFLQGDGRMERAKKFLKYYNNLHGKLQFDGLYILDNGGTELQMDELLSSVNLNFPVVPIQLPYLARGNGNDYLPCWRNLYELKRFMGFGYQKLITIDDDAYILSERLVNHINKINSGWEVFWCQKYKFPEGALTVLCEDSFLIYYGYTKVPYILRNNTGQMEKLLPYTFVNRGFNTDRWGENFVPQNPHMDAYFQCPVEIEMTYEQH